MKLHLIVQEHMEPIPEGVEITDDFGPITLVTSDSSLVYGKNLRIEGDGLVIASWLNPFDGVWFGVGSPMLEQFEVWHIKDGVLAERAAT